MRKDEGFNGLFSSGLSKTSQILRHLRDLLEIAFSPNISRVRGIHFLVVARELQAKDLGA